MPTLSNICDLYILLAMRIKITAKLEAKMIKERKIKNHRELRGVQQNVRMILLTTKVTTALHFLHDIEIYYYHYHTYILYHLFAIKLINYPDGMQQLLVESEGGTVLFQSTNVTILPPGVTSTNGYIK